MPNSIEFYESIFLHVISAHIIASKLFKAIHLVEKENSRFFFLNFFFWIYKMKDLMNAKLFLKGNMSWCTAYNYSDSNKITLIRTYYSSEKWVPQKSMESCYEPKKVCSSYKRFLCLRVSSKHFEEVCLDKSWALQANVFDKWLPKKRKLIDRSISTILFPERNQRNKKSREKGRHDVNNRT